MGHVSDHTPTAAAVEHAALIAALDAGDLAGSERDRATNLVDTCAGCASLLADLAIIRAATATLPAPPRRRDYRLTDADAARLRPSAWRSLIGWLGAPRSSVRPLAGGLAALGIAGLLLTVTPGFLGQAATTVPTLAAPVGAPAGAGSLNGAAPGNAGLNAGPSTAATASAGPAAVSAPLATSAPAGPATTPNAAARPAPSPVAVEPPPSPLAVALPAPAGPMTSPELSGPAASATAGTSGFATGTGAADSGSKAVPPEASSPQRNATLPPASGPATPDRTLPLALSMALLVAGVGLLATNRVLRGRARN